MDRRVLATAIAMAVIGSGLTACGNDPEASPSPATSISTATTPTPTTETPSATPTPSEDPLFTEAKAVHALYMEQILSLEKAGGAETLPPGLEALVTGKYRKDVQDAYRKLKSIGSHADSNSTYQVKWIHQSQPKPGTTFAIRACVDASGVTIRDRSGNISGKGTLRQDDFSLIRRDNRLVIADGDSIRVKKCSG